MCFVLEKRIGLFALYDNYSFRFLQKKQRGRRWIEWWYCGFGDLRQKKKRGHFGDFVQTDLFSLSLFCLYIKQAESFLEVVGELTFEGHSLAGARVGQSEAPRVEHLSVKEAWMVLLKEGFRSGGVDLIAEQGVSRVRHVHSDLVRSAGFKAEAEVAYLSV